MSGEEQYDASSLELQHECQGLGNTGFVFDLHKHIRRRKRNIKMR